MMILVFALSFSGCVTTQGAGGGAVSAKDSGPKSGKMLTKEDYDRIGIKEMGAK